MYNFFLSVNWIILISERISRKGVQNAPNNPVFLSVPETAGHFARSVATGCP